MFKKLVENFFFLQGLTWWKNNGGLASQGYSSLNKDTILLLQVLRLKVSNNKNYNNSNNVINKLTLWNKVQSDFCYNDNLFCLGSGNYH